MKKLVLLAALLFSGLATADQSVLSCDLNLSRFYSMKVMRGSAGYYVLVVVEGSKSFRVDHVDPRMVADRRYAIPTPYGSILRVGYAPKAGWYSSEFGSMRGEHSLADCR